MYTALFHVAFKASQRLVDALLDGGDVDMVVRDGIVREHALQSWSQPRSIPPPYGVKGAEGGSLQVTSPAGPRGERCPGFPDSPQRKLSRSSLLPVARAALRNRVVGQLQLLTHGPFSFQRSCCILWFVSRIESKKIVWGLWCRKYSDFLVS